MSAKFLDYTCVEDYEKDGLKFITPMLAKELEEEEKQDACLNSPDYFVEEKFDGTRATLHFINGSVRCFSRRVSEKTGWFCENSDSVPHIRDLYIPELEGTIIDGEMFIPDRPFKDVASTLNCKWDKAVARQEEIGKIVFHAFDIMYYKGIKLMNMQLHRRKVYLQKVIDALNSAYIVNVPFYDCGGKIRVLVFSDMSKKIYRLRKELADKNRESSYPCFCAEVDKDSLRDLYLSPRAYYEFIVANGGEGVIIKPKSGRYLEKRGWEYSKIKKFLTREAIILGFTEPTKEYKGKFPTVDKWDYWETEKLGIVSLAESTPLAKDSFKIGYYPNDCTPVSKFYAKGWVGNIVFGVIITPTEKDKLPKNKKFNVRELEICGKLVYVVEVGECSGFDEETREYFTKHRDELVGSVIEVKANEIFKDTGKLRHPRFLRCRNDKSALECTWSNHID